MRNLIAVVIACVFAMTGASIFAADTVKSASEASAQEGGRAADQGSHMKKKHAMKKAVKAKGDPCAPGAGDPSASAKQGAKGGDIKCDSDATANTPRDAQPPQPHAKK